VSIEARTATAIADRDVNAHADRDAAHVRGDWDTILPGPTART
jgi:hypothetical protein